KDPECPVCGLHPTITQLIDYHRFCGVPPAPALSAAVAGEINPAALKARLDELPHRLHEIDRSRPIVVHCRMGDRSAMAAEFLRQNGFSGVLNLTGGILAWSNQVDPTVLKY